MKKVKKLPPKDKLELYDKLIQTKPDVQRKGVSMPYTSYNGNMFTYLSPEGILGIRLPEKERAKFLEKYQTTLYQAYGTILKEYVTVPDSLLKNIAELKPYFELSYEYVKTLKTKTAIQK